MTLSINEFYIMLEDEIGLPKNPEDKKWHCKASEYVEPYFLERYGINTKLNLPIQMNPEKQKNKYAIDYIHTVKANTFVDLKAQATPYFTSYTHNVNPQYEKTINCYDIEEYIKREKKEGIKIGILIWLPIWNKKLVDEYNMKYNTNVFLMEGLWATTPEEILELHKDNLAPIYVQKGRRGMDRETQIRENHYINKEECYIFDCRNIKRKLFCNKI